jgi:hypothetical protein
LFQAQVSNPDSAEVEWSPFAYVRWFELPSGRETLAKKTLANYDLFGGKMAGVKAQHLQWERAAHVCACIHALRSAGV